MLGKILSFFFNDEPRYLMVDGKKVYISQGGAISVDLDEELLKKMREDGKLLSKLIDEGYTFDDFGRPIPPDKNGK